MKLNVHNWKKKMLKAWRYLKISNETCKKVLLSSQNKRLYETISITFFHLFENFLSFASSFYNIFLLPVSFNIFMFYIIDFIFKNNKVFVFCFVNFSFLVFFCCKIYYSAIMLIIQKTKWIVCQNLPEKNAFFGFFINEK